MAQELRKRRTRKNLSGGKDRPRLTIFRSNKYLSAQLIDDLDNKTILGFSEKSIERKENTTKTDNAKELGLLIAKEAKTKKIKKIVFDRGPYPYHGRIKSIAEGLREGGLEF